MAAEKKEKKNNFRVVKINYSLKPSNAAFLQSIRGNQLCERENLAAQVLYAYQLFLMQKCQSKISFGDKPHYTHLLDIKYDNEVDKRLEYIALCKKYYKENIPYLRDVVKTILVNGEKKAVEEVENYLQGLDEALITLEQVGNQLEFLDSAVKACFGILNKALSDHTIPIEFLSYDDFVYGYPESDYSKYESDLKELSKKDNGLTNDLKEFSEHFVRERSKDLLSRISNEAERSLEFDRIVSKEMEYFRHEMLAFYYTATKRRISHMLYPGELGIFPPFARKFYGEVNSYKNIKETALNQKLFKDGVIDKTSKAAEVVQLTFCTYHSIEAYAVTLKKVSEHLHFNIPNFLPLVEILPKTNHFQEKHDNEESDDMANYKNEVPQRSASVLVPQTRAYPRSKSQDKSSDEASLTTDSDTSFTSWRNSSQNSSQGSTQSDSPPKWTAAKKMMLEGIEDIVQRDSNDPNVAYMAFLYGRAVSGFFATETNNDPGAREPKQPQRKKSATFPPVTKANQDAVDALRRPKVANQHSNADVQGNGGDANDDGYRRPSFSQTQSDSDS